MKEVSDYTLQDIFREGFKKAPLKYKNNTSKAYWSFLSFANGILFPEIEQLTKVDITRLNNFYFLNTNKMPSSLAESIEFALKMQRNYSTTSLNKKLDLNEGSELQEIVPDTSTGIEDEALTNVFSSAIKSRCSKLPFAQKLTIGLRYFEGFSQAEIGRMRGITRESVGQNERKALNRLSADPYIQSLLVVDSPVTL